MRSIDLQGIVALDQTLVAQLKEYLQEKEYQVAMNLFHVISIPASMQGGEPPFLPSTPNEKIQLAEGVEVFRRNVQKVANSVKPLVPSKDWERVARQINAILWEYVEVLEGCVTELLQRLEQVGFEHWNSELMQAVENIKDLLQLHMENLIWQIQRLEMLLWEYRWACEGSGKQTLWKKIFYAGRRLLDRSLSSYLQKSCTFLASQFKQFSQQFRQFHELELKTTAALRKFSGYEVFNLLEESEKENFKKKYTLLKIWELNQKEHFLPKEEPIRVLRSSYNIKKTLNIFKHYFSLLKEELYSMSRKFKQDFRSLYSEISFRHRVEEQIQGFRAEVHTLGATIAKYREFYLRTHPNPYVRARWSFAVWIVRSEPIHTKELLDLLYEVEELDKFFEKLMESLRKEIPVFDPSILFRHYEEIQHTLHEMGQPLTSKHVMRDRAEKLLSQVEALDELGSFYPETVDYVGFIFSRALRADWQFHVLFDFPLFHKLMQIHQGILGSLEVEYEKKGAEGEEGKREERLHLQRMHLFRSLFDQLKGWVEKKDVYRHIHEIEADMNDMRAGFQDFLGYVQHVAGKEDLNSEQAKGKILMISRELLEYRYAFGRFFHLLQRYEPDGRTMRHQFLFVDQYFEAIEGELQAMRSHTISRK